MISIYISLTYIYIYIYIYLNICVKLYICKPPSPPPSHTHTHTHFLGELRKLPLTSYCKRVGPNYVKKLVVKRKSYAKPLPLHIFEHQVTF